MNERRIHRLREQIKQRLAEILLRDLADPKLGLVTITRVELDAEFTRCQAYWSVIDRPGEAAGKARRQSEEVLRRARGFCQREMGKVLHTRTVPHLEFVFDDGIAEGVRVTELLKELREERELREGGPAAPPTPPNDAEPPRDGS
jgi:ribosome-binding factor A